MFSNCCYDLKDCLMALCLVVFKKYFSVSACFVSILYFLKSILKYVFDI